MSSAGGRIATAPIRFMPLPRRTFPKGPKSTMMRMERYVLRCRSVNAFMSLAKPVGAIRGLPEGQSRDRGRQLPRMAAIDCCLLKERHSHAFYSIFEALAVPERVPSVAR